MLLMKQQDPPPAPPPFKQLRLRLIGLHKAEDEKWE